MANDNKKINTLVAGPDDDPTLELENLAPSSDASLGVNGQSETDQKTYDFDENDGTDGNSSATISALKSDLRTRNESIHRLQYDSEMLRSRWTGLEKEIKAREKLTENVNAELRDTRNQLAQTKRDREKGENEIAALKQQLDASTAELDELSNELQEERSRSEQLDHTEKTNVSTVQDQLEDANIVIADKDAQIIELDRKLARYSENAVDYDQRHAELSAKVTDYESEIRRQRRKIKKLRKQTTGNTAREPAVLKQLVAEQDGQLSSTRQEMHDLRNQISRTEQYADSIRIRLKNAIKASDQVLNAKQQLEASLAHALEQIAELRDQLENERLAGADLAKSNAHLKEQFERDIRQVRLELGAAQETVNDQETINEQLASELIDYRGFKHALESRLEITEKESSGKFRMLDRELKKLRQRNNELEHKIVNKDNSIAALLDELASRNRTIESIGEIEHVIHEIDGRMSERIDDKEAVDRTTRLLIGNIDGQELRFPLFKERLTVGRTSNNDIHLKSQHISRRHAIIETRNDETRIVDWGSKNGVFVNEVRITEQELRNGDIVTIGTADFRYEERAKR